MIIYFSQEAVCWLLQRQQSYILLFFQSVKLSYQTDWLNEFSELLPIDFQCRNYCWYISCIIFLIMKWNVNLHKDKRADGLTENEEESRIKYFRILEM